MERLIKNSIWCWSVAVITVSILPTSQGQLPSEKWKPVFKPQLAISTFHESNNFASYPSYTQRYGGGSKFGQFDPTLVNHIPSFPTSSDGCTLSKVAFNQELFFQYMQYKTSLPDMKEFTLCMWTKFNNHSTDHPLFSYKVGDNPKAIDAWVSNTDRASYYSLAVAGHTFYRLNYPLKINRWYHSCQSWNGRTGEWQVWINGERTGRGFHNRLVGHVIKGGGIAITGQDHTQLSGQKQDGIIPTKVSAGMIGEVTMVQMYHVALTAGKAHKDHKHHHVHHFDHNGAPLEITPPPPPPTQPPNPNAILIAGQINPMLELNLGGNPQFIPALLPNGVQLNAPFVNGQFSPARTISEQLLNSRINNRLESTSFPGQIKFTESSPLGGPPGSRLLLSSQLAQPANVQFIDASFTGRPLIKREDKSSSADTKKVKRESDLKKMDAALLDEKADSKKQTKRGLIELPDGTIVDDGNYGEETFEQSLLSGLAGLGENLQIQNIQKEKVDDREPAEAEVKAVMDICSGCAEEPFQRALVLSWRHTPKKRFNGAQYHPAVPSCKAF